MRLLLLAILLVSALPLRSADLDFVGLRSYAKKDLLKSIAGRLYYVTKREATPFRADDAAFLVESFLRTHGLPDATVSWSLPGNGTILLTVDEGISKFLGPITVVGYDDLEAVTNQFKAPFPEADLKRSFDAEAIPIGITRVTDLMHTEGYWQASAKSTQGARLPTGEIPFTLTITPGPRFILATPIIKSPVPPSAKLLARLQEITGSRADAETILKVRKTITESYRRQGYPGISASMLKESDGSNLRITFDLTPGKKFSVRSFQVTGLKKTKPHRVSSRFKDLIGENYDENKANEEIKKLLATGAFDSVRLTNKEFGDTELDLTLHLSEAKARGYSFSGGVGSYEGLILGSRYYDRNLWGRLFNFTAGLELTSLGVLGEVSFTNPYFLNRHLTRTNRAFLITRDFEGYDKLQGGGSIGISWDRGDHYSASLSAEVSFTDITSDLPKDLIGPDSYVVNRIDFRQTYDRRNDQTLPSRGWFARLDTSLGFASGSDSIGFFETEAQYTYYKSLGKRSGYSVGARGGFIIPTGDSDDLPIDLRKFLGGANTIRSFPEREMGREFDGDPLGGTAWWIANFEYTRTITGPVKGAIFFDAAALDSNVEMALGLGVRVDLPVGPIRLEYGHSLSRDSGEPAGAFHFAIGTTF